MCYNVTLPKRHFKRNALEVTYRYTLPNQQSYWVLFFVQGNSYFFYRSISDIQAECGANEVSDTITKDQCSCIRIAFTSENPNEIHGTVKEKSVCRTRTVHLFSSYKIYGKHAVCKSLQKR